MSDEERDEETLAQSLVGRTITRVRWFDASPDHDWTGHEEAWLWLDDGRVVEFGAWGHDAWGATLDEIEVMDVEKCNFCGEEHKDQRVFSQKNGAKHAYCTDGNNNAWRQ